MRPVLHLSYAAGLDWLECAPLGVVMDRQGSDRWEGVSDKFGWFLAEPGGPIIGFKIVDFSEFDAEAEAAIFSGPRFDVAALGLRDVSAGEIVLAALPFLDGCDTIDRVYFDAAIGADGDEALGHWIAALQAGNSMAHYGAGYTLLELGRDHDAYRHLRAYTELVPRDPWAWAYRARAALAIGERAEARSCCERAIEMEEVYDEETDAAELLEEIDGPTAPPKLVWTEVRDTLWTAIGATGTHWDIVKLAERRYGVIVEHWDRPDWYAETLEAAMAIAEERDAAPPIPPEEWIPEQPFD